MSISNFPNCTAFAGNKAIGSGMLLEVAELAKREIDNGETANILIFDDRTSEPIEIDFRGDLTDVKRRLEKRFECELPKTKTAESVIQIDQIESTYKRPGRPKLGVVAREVTLLPRHWEWLQTQQGGASVALRRLVDEARKENKPIDLQRQKTEITYKFMSAMCGNMRNFEEATRSLFAYDGTKFFELTETWPEDIQNHLRKISVGAF